eukprot:TRINITY_DN8301_c0_g1_i4.p1 TRINITY_DN8301_c0_g1~~TRINITY_DN8301_c0_g1_i4.p1  ORF type:complete len:301 (+),score=40.20 TRINITY_DN8301_c0_g1_i4:429-1331(+)
MATAVHASAKDAVDLIQKASHLVITGPISLEEEKQLAEAITNPLLSSNLESFILYANDTAEDFTTLINSFDNRCHLKTLVIGRCLIGKKNASILAESLLKNETITSLTLVENFIDAECLRHIGTILAKPNLKFLDLRKNPLEEEGGEILASFLKTNDTLEILELSGCYLRQRGVGAVLDGASECTSLASLRLSGNQLIDDAGTASALCRHAGGCAGVGALVLASRADHENGRLAAEVQCAWNDWRNMVIPSWEDLALSIVLSQTSPDSPLYFLGVLLPQLADLTFVSLLDVFETKQNPFF